MNTNKGLRDEIKFATDSLDITDTEFKEVSKYQWEQIQKTVEDTFIVGKAHNLSMMPYWEHLKGDYFNISFPKDNAFVYLDNLIDNSQPVWFLAQDNSKLWIYEGLISSIREVIEECYAFEYYIVSKKYSWLLCENHHGCLIGIGEDLVRKMKALQI